jgi:exopolysaccharide production protein ExoQ
MSSEVLVHAPPTKWMSRPPYRGWAPMETNLPIWRLSLGWVLLFPMLYLAANGNILLGANAASSTTEAAGGSSSLHKVAVALLSLIFLAVIVTCKAPLLRSLLSSKLVLSLPLLAMCSSFWSEQPIQSFISSFLLFVFTIFTICIATEFDFQQQVELIMMVGAVALPISIILAIVAPSIGGSSAGWRGAFGHKQNCAAVSTLWLITALHWRSPRFHRQLVKTLYIVMCVVLIVMSQSRTGWLLALVSVLLWSILWAAQRVRRLELVLGLAVSLPIALVTAYIIFTQYGTVATSVGKDATLSQRTIIWKAVWDSIALRPNLGYGYSAFWTGLNGPSQRVVLISGWGIQQAQNGYLDLWLSLGIGGVVVVALMAVAAIMTSSKIMLSREANSYSRWCTVIVVSALLYNMGESSLGLLQMVWFLFLLAYVGLQSLGRKKNAWEHFSE